MKKEIKFYVSTILLLITFSVTSNVSLGSYSYSTHVTTNQNSSDKFDSCLGAVGLITYLAGQQQVVRDWLDIGDDNFIEKLDVVDNNDFSEFDCQK